MSIREEIREFIKQKLEERISKLEQHQIDFLFRVYPLIYSLSNDKICEAIELCDRTLKKRTKPCISIS